MKEPVGVDDNVCIECNKKAASIDNPCCTACMTMRVRLYDLDKIAIKASEYHRLNRLAENVQKQIEYYKNSFGLKYNEDDIIELLESLYK
jgi:hypothetical protein